MSTHLPDKKKYEAILKTQGLSAALTELHREMNELEFESFEGAKGYQADLWEDIKVWRNYSVELWRKHQDMI
ncbi:MAG: hypothetical protein CL678_17275 [Bdellovibrionaceae bacterium]|nr:hypothetical protein [Pseudobdellovibrionaceae bacterium]|tara:strand:+ start:1735 stop:1950 length:216 start_codon:yes stop_codon:yes gene_type:complete